jgi:hypothetical protein
MCRPYYCHGEPYCFLELPCSREVTAARTAFAAIRAAVGASLGEGFDLDDSVGETQRGFQGVGEAGAEVVADDEAIDDDLDRVLALAVEVDLVGEVADRAVHAHAGVALTLQVEEELLVFALASADHRRQDQQPRAGRQRQHAIDHLLYGLRGDHPAAAGTVRDADAGEQHAQIVVDLGDGADGRPRVLGGRLLLDRDRRRRPSMESTSGFSICSRNCRA